MNTIIAMQPAILVSTPMELIASPLCIGSLFLLSPYSFSFFRNFPHFPFFIFIFITVHKTHSFQRWNRDPDLLRADEVVPSEK